MDKSAIDWARKQIGLETAAAPTSAATAIAGAPKPEAEPLPAEPAPSTFIGEGAEFEGVLRIRTGIRLNCEFRGEIVSDDTVVLGEAAGIQASIRAREVVIGGALVGDVKASRQVVIRSTGRLHGDVETPCLEIDKGAVFNGRTSMARPEAAARASTQSVLPPRPTTPGWRQVATPAGAAAAPPEPKSPRRPAPTPDASAKTTRA